MQAWRSCWIFAYGSLMWNPGFPFKRKLEATLKGYTRSVCMYSYEARGNREFPGLVLGLIPGKHVHGFAFEVEEGMREKIYNDLIQRENTPLACYIPCSLPVCVYEKDVFSSSLTDDKILQSTYTDVEALCFIADPDHEQFAKAITHEQRINIISKAKGTRGTSHAYLEATLVCLRDCGISDSELEDLLLLVQDQVRLSIVPPN
eukprot:TRINITY_DN5639_c0_g1_i1.p1 TRINITY_DN5639_c0_g1~~TRINITY_DN5639_c0_g1_i1.p1  ORF type:complete len:204 (+),score=33.59 TRINITY_DN5639_c0_g1_i1:6-617(+)